MRWSIVRLIWARELRDQLRDRRTIFMIAVLPVLLYPVAGFGLMQLAVGFLTTKNKVCIVGATQFQSSPRSAAAWLTLAPPPTGIPFPAGCAAAAGALAEAPGLEAPPLLYQEDGRARFLPHYLDYPREADSFLLRLDDGPLKVSEDASGRAVENVDGLRVDRTLLDTKEVDLLVVVPPNFLKEMREGGRPKLYMFGREGDDRSRLVSSRFNTFLARWKKQLKNARLLRVGLTTDFDDPFEVRDAEKPKAGGARAAEDLFEVLTRIFPFVLVMWALAGALYPAVDLCAGEKERGTMETLLISPATREEIVWGKFLTIWVFSGATALLNLLSMGFTTWLSSAGLAGDSFRPVALAWGVLLLMPLSAFFSALCLAVGAYARSSKEGQYYLMPLFLVTMPLIFLTLAPGVELNPFYSMVPVTGVALLLQKLMAAGTPDRTLWLYFIPVLVPMVIYGWLALRWAIEQFQREEVLFREAERLDLGLWFKRLFRDKDALPSTGQALFCFLLVLASTGLSLRTGNRTAPAVQLLVIYLAFVAAPPLFMALVLTRRPRDGLALRSAPAWAWAVAAGLALLLFVPGVELTYLTVQSLGLRDSIRDYHEAMEGNDANGQASPALAALLLVAVSLLQSGCEELAFRGFILSGLRRRFRPWTSVCLSSFLFALFQMNVFQFIPHFVLGVVMGALVLRTGSLLPAILFHFVYNLLVYSSLGIAPELFPGFFQAMSYENVGQVPYATVRVAISSGCLLLAATILAWTVRRQFPATQSPSKGGAPAQLNRVFSHVPNKVVAGEASVPEPE